MCVQAYEAGAHATVCIWWRSEENLGCGSLVSSHVHQARWPGNFWEILLSLPPISPWGAGFRDLGFLAQLWRIWTQTSGFCSKHFRVVSRRSLSLSLLLPLLPSLWLPLPPPSPSLPPYISLSYNLSLLTFLRVQTVLPGGLGMADGKHLPAGVRAAAGSLEPN